MFTSDILRKAMLATISSLNEFAEEAGITEVLSMPLLALSH